MRSVARGFKTQDDRCKSFILNPTKVHSSCTSRNKLKKFVRQERQSYKNQVKQNHEDGIKLDFGKSNYNLYVMPLEKLCKWLKIR